MTDNAKALADHIRSDLTYITGLADHMEAGGDVSKKNIGDLIAMVRWNAEHHLECRDTIEIQGREIERLQAALRDLLLYAAPNTLGSLPVFNRARATLAGENND